MKYLANLTPLLKACAFVCALLLAANVHAHPGGHERIMSLNEQIAHEPKNAYLLIKRAQELIEEDKNFAPAKTDLEKAKSLGATEDSSFEFNFVMGLYNQYQDKHEVAIGFFKRCTELDNNHLQCHRAWAESALVTKDSKTAIKVLTNFITTSKTAQTDDYFHLAQLLEKDQNKHKALMFLDQAQAKFGVLPHFEKYAIKIETSNKNFQKALERHQALKPYFGKTPQWQYEQGVLFQSLGKSAQARMFYEQAIATLDNKKKKKSKANANLLQDIQAKLASLEN